MTTVIVKIFLLIFTQLHDTLGNACNTDLEIGKSDPSNLNAQLDTEPGTAILMIQNQYRYSCCGFVYKWEFFSTSTVNGTFDAQVWRADTGGGDMYFLIGYNTLTPTDPGNLEDITISNGQRIRVDNGDNIGIHSTGTFVITHDDGGGGGGGRKKLTGRTSLMTSPSPYDWSTGENRVKQYEINSYVTPSTAPVVPALSGVSFYDDETFIGQVMKTVTATDSDIEDMDQITFTLQTIDQSGTTYFEIVAGSDNITVKAIPVINVYTATVKAEDLCGESSTGTVQITILNRPPSINNLPDSISLPEETISAFIFTINATDTTTDPVTCSMQSGDTNNFRVSVISGTTYGVYVKTSANLDYDTASTHTVTVRCDDGADTVDADLTINLIKNWPPEINSLPDSTSFLEDVNTTTLLHTLNVTDANNDTVACSLNPTSTIFNVSPIPSSTDYGIYLTGGTNLDYDTTPSYAVTVECADQLRSDTDTFTINLIRNTPPVINSLPETTNISEDLSTRTLLHTINTTDVNGDIITCTLNPTSTIFDISSFEIYLTGGTTLDYDITPSYTVTVECADHRRSDTETYTIDLIRNEPPTINNLPRSVEMREDLSTETLLYTISVTDPTNDTVTCIVTTTTTMFYMQIGANQYEYDIFVRSNQVFSYDTLKSYTLDISCADHRRSGTAPFYIYLLRNMPSKFTNIQGKISVSALTAAGQTVFTVLADDPENDQLQYSMTSLSSDPPFVININTGEMSLSRSILTESIPGYDMLFNVTDGRNTVGPVTLTVRITDMNSPPVLKNLPQTMSILENVNIGTSIFKPDVEDEDVSNTHTFSVTYSPPEGAVYFDVNKADGTVTTLVDIDYETISSQTFTLTFTVTDSYMTDNGTLTIDILNVNEAPKFTKTSYSFTTMENTAGTVLQNPYFQHSDEDGDTMTFSADCGSETGRLDIDSSTGFFSYAIEYDLDQAGTPSLIQCQVYIRDNEYTATASVNISVIDVNDNYPVFQHKEYTFFVQYDAAVGANVGQVLAIDDDIGVNGDLIYHIEQGNDVGLLLSISNDGTLTVAQSLSSYYGGAVLSFIVYAVDTGSLQDQTVVTLVLPDTSVNTDQQVDNTITYFTFFSYAPNMAWFVPLNFILLAAAIFIIYLIYTSKCDCTCSLESCRRKFQRNKPKQKRNKRPRRINESNL